MVTSSREASREASMQAVLYSSPGGPEVLHTAHIDVPVPGSTEVRLKVRAAGVNRAEVMQRQGNYPAPPGQSPILGLEACGLIQEVGSQVEGWKVGDRVMALLNGGGYAEQVVVDAGCMLAVPDGWTDTEAAGFMETTLTAFLNVFQIGGASKGGTVLIHGGGSGVGTQAAALCKARGIKTIVTCGSDTNCRKAAELGVAGTVLNYKTEDWTEVLELTQHKGVDVLLDCVGGPYLSRNLKCLAMDGRLVIIGLIGGPKVEEGFDLGVVLRKRASIIGSTLRNRSTPFKGALVASLKEKFGQEIHDGSLKPILDKVYPLQDAGDAHRRLEGRHFGKVILSVTPL